MKQLIVFLCAFCWFGSVASSDELSKIKSQISQTEQQDKKLTQQVKTAQRDVDRTKKDLVVAADKVSTLEYQRGTLSRKIADLDTQHDMLVGSLVQNKTKISDMVGGILFVASHPSFDSDDMHNYVLTSAVLSGVSQNLDNDIKSAAKKIQELERIRDTRAVEKEKLDRTAKKYATEKNQLDKLLQTRSAQNEKLKTQQTVVRKKLQDLSERAKSISELSAGVGSSEMLSDSRFSRRKINLPVRGKIVVRFGEKTALGLRSDGWRIHVRSGALVVAPADGVVKFADTFRGFGRVVIMSHKNGYNTVMTNLRDLN